MFLSFLPTESWMVLAVLGAALVGIGNSGEKVLSIRYMPDATTLMLWLAISLIIYSVIFAILYPFHESVPRSHIAAIFGSGIMYGIAITTLYRILRTTDASIIFSIFNTSPIFVAIFALLLLDQLLTFSQWGSIILVVLGIMILSREPSELNKKPKIYVVMALIICAGLAGLSQVASSYALTEVTPENGFWAQRIGALLPILFNLKRNSFGKFWDTVKQPRILIFVLLVEAVIMPLGHLSFLTAMKIGHSVALVSALFGTVPLWVFVITTVLSTGKLKILSENINPRRLFMKSIAITVTVLGIVGITLL